jgi:hypothetical protein
MHEPAFESAGLRFIVAIPQELFLRADRVIE